MLKTPKYLIRTLCQTIILILLTTSCHNYGNNAGTVFTASIPPIKYLVENITCGDFPVEILVPDGANPESYSPSPSQIVQVEDSKLIFTSGLIDFEKELVSRLPADKGNIIDLSKGVALKAGSCSHSTDAEGHTHSIDPHIWTSPKQLKIMASNTYEAISRLFPDSLKYRDAYEALLRRLDAASETIAGKIAVSPTRTFVIYHPALTYYARDYGLVQIALENEGKEPSAIHMEQVIREAQKERIGVLLYQKQFPVTAVSAVARDMNVVPMEIDPLATDIISEIERITDIITGR